MFFEASYCTKLITSSSLLKKKSSARRKREEEMNLQICHPVVRNETEFQLQDFQFSDPKTHTCLSSFHSLAMQSMGFTGRNQHSLITYVVYFSVHL